jgi:hypothetical protein
MKGFDINNTMNTPIKKRKFYSLGIPNGKGVMNSYLIRYLTPKAFFLGCPGHAREWDTDLLKHHKLLVDFFNSEINQTIN